MNQIKRMLALVLTLLMLLTLCLTAFTGCGGDPSETTGASSGETTGDPSGETTGGSGTTPDGKADYTVTVTTAGGLPLEDVTLLVYADSTLEDLVGYGSTGEDGKAKISLDAGKTYSVVIGDAPEGYAFEESYPIVGASTEIRLTSSVVTDSTSLSGVSYQLGDIMRDFTFQTTDGKTLKLSEVLKEKDMVLLNFWYVDCSACRAEFPVMQTVYEDYKDQIEIIAVTPFDNTIDAASFKESFGLTFPVAAIDTALATSFGVNAYPTSVIIDRYGMISIIEVGAITTERPFRAIFDRFSGENYKQEIFEDPSVLTPKEEPTVEMPSSDEIAAALGTANLGIEYSPETEGESAKYAWPFLIGEKNGKTCIYPSNAKIEDSFAILYAKVNLKKGDVLALDYFASSEKNVDMLYILVDRRDIYRISGEGTGWETCYPFVALEDGEYELSLCYMKDGTDSVGEDRVYVKDLRVESIADIDVATYIPRNVATKPNADGFGYGSYATIVYNETDGYYHVGTKDGPLLFASLMNASLFTGTANSVWSVVYGGNSELYEEMVNYFSYASNSAMYGYCPVTTELREFLETVAEEFGLEQTENEWLQMCCYYDAYGTNGVQLADPTAGLWYHSAIKAELGKNNSVTYDRPIMPRGLWYEFVPQKSGVYRINSQSEEPVDGWIFLEDGTMYYQYEGGERLNTDLINCSMAVYLEAGTSYYIDIAYEDVYCVGTFNFEISYVAEEAEIFIIASPGFFTFYESEDGVSDVGHIVVGGIDVKLGDDGYYHELRKDGTLGSIVYVDFNSPTNIFARTSLKEMIEKTHSFNQLITEDDQWVLDWLEIFEKDGVSYTEGFKIEWGDEYDYYMDYYKVEDVVAGRYHGSGKDYTEIARKYISKMLPASASAPELEGCVAVTAELAEALQALMDKFTFKAENSWTKLCYYYQYLGPEA